ncbi:MAG: ribonuclease III [Lachnospiraceae bacterium]|nr:ribonuclease III [Lachnospiraceae bacterium]MBR6302698.1 ribonuclease III [Lachnospiraceae bacterium]MBR6908860.1 ribonuclease III [Lachnospiraceae bacterium]
MNTLDLNGLEEAIGYKFKDKGLLKQALTHSSYANEQKINKSGDYERLEFLGDAVLEVVSSEFLFHKYPDLPEGRLTKLRASMVCEPSLAICARDLDLGKYILLGKGEESTGGRGRESITSDVMEAIIGAIFLDGGMEKAKEHINRFILSDLENKVLFYDSKSTLQEVMQGELKKEFEYVLIGESGPEHDKEFEVRVMSGKSELGRGKGRTKKAAEQQAAYEALLKLRDQGYVSKKY